MIHRERRFGPAYWIIALFGLALAGRTEGAAPVDNRLIVASDQSISYATGMMTVLEKPGIGSLLIIDLGVCPARTRAIPAVPVSVIGPPTSVALHPNAPLALVTSAMRAERVDGKMQHVPDKRVSLVQLDGAHPGVIATVEVGQQPSSVSFLPHGRTALVTNRSEGTISVLAVDTTGVKESARVAVAGPEDSLAHIEVSPDGTLAIATLHRANEVLLLNLAADGQPTIVDRAKGGSGPYAARFLPDGRRAVVAYIGSDEIVFYALENGRFRQTGTVSVGRIPEGIDVSPDGEWIAVNCMEGANLDDRTHPSFGEPGRVHLLRRNGEGYASAGVLEIGGGPQAAVFSPDGKFLLVTKTGGAQVVLYRQKQNTFVATGEQWAVAGEPIAARRKL
jgi:DNA-binding beta-propeller fold protein YncE